MISNIYARRDDIELISPERVSAKAKNAVLPDFEKVLSSKERELN